MIGINGEPGRSIATDEPELIQSSLMNEILVNLNERRESVVLGASVCDFLSIKCQNVLR